MLSVILLTVYHKSKGNDVEERKSLAMKLEYIRANTVEQLTIKGVAFVSQKDAMDASTPTGYSLPRHL